MNLIVLEPHEVDASGDVTLTDHRAMHLIEVLKVGPGRPVRVGRLDGPFGTATVTSASDRTVTMQCEFERDIPERPRVDLLLALPRPKVMNRLWAQLSALGVGQIILTNAERVDRNYFDTHVLDPEHYRPLLVEGLQQARDTRLPVVSIHRQFKILIEDQLDGLFPEGRRIVADPVGVSPAFGERGQTPTAARSAGLKPCGYDKQDRVLLAIGPEGGWNAFELDLLRAHGFDVVSMGPRTLRSDTACIALLTLAHDATRTPSTSN